MQQNASDFCFQCPATVHSNNLAYVCSLITSKHTLATTYNQTVHIHKECHAATYAHYWLVCCVDIELPTVQPTIQLLPANLFLPADSLVVRCDRLGLHTVHYEELQPTYAACGIQESYAIQRSVLQGCYTKACEASIKSAKAALHKAATSSWRCRTHT